MTFLEKAKRGWRYFRPLSLAWWGGAILIATGIMQAMNWPPVLVVAADGETSILDKITVVILALTGGDGAGVTTPAALIGIGAGIIGVRDAQQRSHDKLAASGGRP